MANKYIRHGAADNGDGTTSALALGSTVTITIATPGVVSWAGHSFVADDPVYFSTTGALPTGLVAGTKYHVCSPTTNTFQVSATAGGAAINTSGTQSGTHRSFTPGAWNDLAVFEGTAPSACAVKGAGSVDDSDVVFIRSKDASGADITRTLSAASVTLGKSGLSLSSAGVQWVIDNGVTWSGVSGVIKYTRTAAYSVSLRSYNWYVALTPDALVLECNHSASNTTRLLSAANEVGIYAKNLWVKCDTVGFYSDNGPIQADLGGSANGQNTFENLRITVGKKTWGVVVSGDYARNIAINLNIELKSATPVNTAIFNMGQYGSTLALYGGQLWGAGATDTGGFLLFLSGSSKFLELYGFEYPKTFPLLISTFSGTQQDCGILATGLDSGIGSLIRRSWGQADSRSVNNYPYLNSTYPNTASTPWSWRIWPRYARHVSPMELPFFALFTDTAGVRTVTLELLVANSFTGATKGKVWLEVHYVEDSGGLPRVVTTMAIDATSALDSSGVTWLPSNSWGAVSCTPRKISVVTPSAIKQDTNVMVVLRGIAASSTVNDVIFADPHVKLTA